MTIRSDCYVYVLFRETGEPLYVGLGRNKRWLHHENLAKNGATRPLYRIIRDMQDRGEEVIRLKAYENLTVQEARIHEAALIEAFGRAPAGPLVNIRCRGSGFDKHSDATRALLSKLKIGRKHTLEHRAKNAANKRGKKLTIEHRARIAAAVRRPEVRAKLVSGRLGKKNTPEHNAKIAAALSRPEVRAKLVNAKLGKPLTAEHRAKISAANFQRWAATSPKL